MALRVLGYGGQVSIKVDDILLLNSVAVPSTGSWAKWTSANIGNLELTKGEHTIQVYVDKDGFNFNYFDLEEIITEDMKAYFFQNTFYDGDSAFLTEGDFTTFQLINKGIKDNDVSSVRVPSGYKIELYDGDNFTGSMLTLSGDEPDLVAKGFNDMVSSVKMIRSQVVTDIQNSTLHKDKFIQLFPNPAKDLLQVILANNEEVEKIELTDVLGNIVKEEKGSVIDVSGLSKRGLYS